MKVSEGLRIEESKGCSGDLLQSNKIPFLKEDCYIIDDVALQGDAPKQMISAYFFEKNSAIRKQSPKTWKKYICKTAEKWYPIESFTEYMINKIGETLDLSINNFKIVRANKQIRFLSEFFLEKDEKLIHGAEICGEFLNDMERANVIANSKNRSKQHFTYEFITSAIRNVFPNDFEKIQVEMFKMIVFDAIVGNNDRHFFNWGVITHLKKSNKSVIFAPIYDSARGLLWNTPDGNLLKLIKHETKLEKYLYNSLPRISLEENKTPNHFELIEFIIRRNKEYQNIVQNLVSTEKEKEIFKMLEEECFPFLTKNRRILVKIVLTKRLLKIRKICG